MSLQAVMAAPVSVTEVKEAAVQPRTVLAALPLASRRRSVGKGLALLGLGLSVYTICTLVVCSAAMPIWARAGASLMLGVAIAMLFIIGHDACHGSLTPSATLNQWIGRIGFLPALHPYTSWEYYHNGLHHGQTNIKGLDPVYCPFTKAEFDALPRWRQQLEKVYRTPFGVMLYYGVEYWWRGNLFPINHHKPLLNARPEFRRDQAMVLGFLGLQAALCVLLNVHWATPFGFNAAEAALDLTFVLLVPHMFWNWLMGFTTFQHHTHPLTRWFRNREAQSFFERQVRNTVEVVFPRWIEVILHDIMAHTAHHVAPRIPLYNLKGAQTSIQAAYPQDVVRVNFTVKGYLDTLRRCRLYDYDHHRWLDYDGTPTT